MNNKIIRTGIEKPNQKKKQKKNQKHQPTLFSFGFYQFLLKKCIYKVIRFDIESGWNILFEGDSSLIFVIKKTMSLILETTLVKHYLASS